LKRFIVPFILMMVVGSMFLWGRSGEEKRSKKGESEEVVLEKELTQKEKYEGTWVNRRESMGRNTLTLAFENDEKAVMEYVYAEYIEQTPAVVKAEVVFDEHGEATFTFEDDGWGHKGRGDLFLEEGKVDVYIKTDKNVIGGRFGVQEKITEFVKPDRKSVTYRFKKIEQKVKMKKKGYLPNERVTYRYQTTDGIAHDKEVFKKLADGNMSASSFDQYGEYNLTEKGLYFTDSYNVKKRLIKFPLKEKESWKASEGTKRTVVDTDYTLNGLKDVLVIKEMGDDAGVSYIYYHEKYGKVGTGVDKGGRHVAEWILVDIDN
jgi:hypothetical protein